MTAEKQRNPERENQTAQQPSRPWLFLSAAFVVAIVTIGYAAKNRYGRELLIQAICLLAALLCTAPLGWRLLRFRSLAPPRRAGWLCLGLVLLACALRYWSLQILPFANQAGFEEVEMGGDGYILREAGYLPVEFRYSKVLAALAPAQEGGALHSLRLPYQVAGYLSLLFLVLCLRALRVGWLPTALVAVTAATLRWLVIAGGVADESFSAVPMSLALLWLLTQSDRSRTHCAFWAAATGILAGMLFYEYVSFRPLILLAAGWLSWKALPRRESGKARRQWLPLICFLLTFTLVSAPALVEVFHVGTRSILFDGLTRHGRGRTTLAAPGAVENIKGYLCALFGLPFDDIEKLTPTGQALILPPVGFFFAVSGLAGLLRPRLPLVRILVLTVAAMIAAAGALANDYNSQRITSALPLLLVIVGAFLGDAYRWLRRLLRKRTAGASPRLRSRTMLLVTLAAALLALVGNLRSINSMAANQGVRGCWVDEEDTYPILRHIELFSHPWQRVLVQAPDLHGYEWSRPVVYWVYARKHPRISAVDEFPSPQQILPGTLAVVAYRGGAISENDVGNLLSLAAPSGSEASLRISEDLMGRKAAASVCIQCP